MFRHIIGGSGPGRPAVPGTLLLSLVALLGLSRLAAAQVVDAQGAAQPALGSVDVQSASVAGALEVSDGKALVRGGGVITARERTAELRLNRGGTVEVCATSSLHITAGTAVLGVPPLLLALDRGAMEVHATASARDVVITPDLRLTVTSAGPLDLRLRVTPNGDTCVEHRGLQAPSLEIVDVFGDAHYELRAGQHVLFEHGSLREVVDHESSPCGCPTVPVSSVARSGESSVPSAAPGASVAPPGAEIATQQHPFPAAESQGLTRESAAAAVPQTPAGQPHAQVAATLAYGATGSSDGTGSPATDAAGTASPSTARARGGQAAAPARQPAPSEASKAPEPAPAGAPRSAANTSTRTERAETPPPGPPPAGGDVIHSLGRFFRRLFGRG